MRQARSSCLILALNAPANALRFSNLFGDHMVLQANAPVPLWGFAASPGANVTVSLSVGTSAWALADAAGAWAVSLPSLAPSFDGLPVITVTASDGGSVAVLSDVLAGDVLLISGQSNAQFSVNAAVNASAEVQAANNFPLIRLFAGPVQSGAGPNPVYKLDSIAVNTTYPELGSIDLPWSVASNETIATSGTWQFFSALGWFAARDLYLANKAADPSGRVTPVGAISQCYGGTSIQWWSSARALEQCASVAAPGSSCCSFGGSDSCLWDSQVFPYAAQGGHGATQLKSVLYYQGEQNAGCGGDPQMEYYACALPAMIADWRAAFQQPALPFGICTLAAWQSADPWFPLLRLIQVDAAVSLTDVFLINSLDLGQPARGPVHSPFKQEVGRRASLGLRAVAYGDASIPFRGPRALSATAVSDPKDGLIEVSVAFDPASLYGTPLLLNTTVVCPSTINNTSCESFAVLTSDCVWRSVEDAGPDGSCLVPAVNFDATTVLALTLLGVPGLKDLVVVAVRGSFGNWPLVQLRNGAGLPAEPWLMTIAPNQCPPPGSTAAWEAGEGALRMSDAGEYGWVRPRAAPSVPRAGLCSARAP